MIYDADRRVLYGNDPERIIARHQPSANGRWCWPCQANGDAVPWPCVPYLLATDLILAREESAAARGAMLLLAASFCSCAATPTRTCAVIEHRARAGSKTATKALAPSIEVPRRVL